MREIEVRWVENFQFVAVSPENHTVVMDASPGGGGKDQGIRPPEMLLMGMAGCTSYDIVAILRKKRQKLTDLKVTISGEARPEPPNVYTAISVHYSLKGIGLSEKAVKRAIELSMEKYCSAGAMLAATAKIAHSYDIQEAN